MSRLTTATDVIDALGGTQAVARLLNVGASAVSNYRRLGFPARAYYKLSLACAQKGLDVAEAVFGGLQSLETAQPLRPPLGSFEQALKKPMACWHSLLKAVTNP